jgi:glycosyltransferase involved in cell wall biosynthesis
MITEQWSGYLSGAYQKLGFFKKHWYKKAFRSSIINTGVSVKLATAIDRLFKTKKPTLVLPNIAEATPAGQNKNTTELKILVVADLVDEIKNISGVILAFAQAQLDRAAVLTIIGDGIDRVPLEQLAAEQELNNKKIAFKGRYENAQVLAAMQENDFLITNSYHETFSMVTAEALLAGMPVICTRCGGPEEFVNETNGILIDTGNDEQLQSAIEKMSHRYSSYLTSDLSQPVLEKFGIEAVGHQLQKIYVRILG